MTLGVATAFRARAVRMTWWLRPPGARLGGSCLLPFRVLPERCSPADWSFPGHCPAQLARCPAVENTLDGDLRDQDLSGPCLDAADRSALNERVEHRPPALAEDVGRDAVELDAGVLQRLVQPLRFTFALGDLRAPIPRQQPQIPDRLGRHEARAQQARLGQPAQPRRIADIGLAAREGDAVVLGPIAHRSRQEFEQTGRQVVDQGRPTIAVETYVRLMILKQRYRWTY
jgi:hypothetical protein